MPGPSAATASRHSFCWMDLKVHDPAGLAEFFAPVFGWSFAVDEADWRRATVVSTGTGTGTGGHRLAGVSDLSAPVYPPGLPAHAASYLAVADIGSSLGTAVSLGAEVVQDVFDLGALGRMATLTDPCGAAVTLWQRGEFASWSFPVGEPGAPDTMVLAAPNADHARDFYTRVLGAEPPRTEFVTTDAPEHGVEGAPRWEAVIGVTSADAVAERAREHGGRVTTVSGGDTGQRTAGQRDAGHRDAGGTVRVVGPEGLAVRLRQLG